MTSDYDNDKNGSLKSLPVLRDIGEWAVDVAKGFGVTQRSVQRLAKMHSHVSDHSAFIFIVSLWTLARYCVFLFGRTSQVLYISCR